MASKKLLNSLIKIEWLDANQRDFTQDLIDNVDILSIENFLIKKTTYGKLIAINKDIIIIQHEEDNYSIDEKDCTIVPRSWVLSPKSLRDKRMICG